MQKHTRTAAKADLRQARLPADDRLADLLTVLRNRTETHVTLAQLAHEAAAAGLGANQNELLQDLNRLAHAGLLGHVPWTGTEPVFDTEPAPHSHIVYEGAQQQIVDLHVSGDTLLSIVRDALTTHGDKVDVLIRIHGQGHGHGHG